MKLKKLVKPLLIAVAVIAAAAGIYFYFFSPRSRQDDRGFFKTEPVVRTTIQRTIAATGTVEPEELVNVGAQVNGKIMSFGKDADGRTVDYGSRVTAGMILAQIDDETYQAELQSVEAQIKQAEAGIESARAAIKSAEAGTQSADAALESAEAVIAEAVANEALAQNNWARAQELYPQGSMTRSDYDSYQAALNTAKAVTNKVRAQLEQAKAQKAQALAQKAQAEAQLQQAEAQKAIADAALVKARRNLEYCKIISPVDGVVIDRRVSVGQTVVSNQTASSIFLVARDFKKMQVWVSVNEADVGSIKPGMKVVFTCDAFPNTEFYGTVNRLRLNATLSSNVVTYIVEVNADNSGGKLIPYLTANVKFIRAEDRDTLAVPVSALRYMPPEELQISAAPEVKGRREGVIWVKEGEKARPVKVTLGISNNILAAVKSDELQADMLVITGVEQTAPGQHGQVGQSGEKNPFMPNMPKRPGRGSAGQRERAAQRGAQQNQ